MEINNFYIYSSLSSNKDNSEEVLAKILEQAKHFESIDEIDNAKKYLQEAWNIKDAVRNYPICNKCLLNIIESPTTFCINLVYEKENTTYYYQK